VEALRASTLGRQGAARIDLARLAGVAEADLGTLAWFAMPELDRFHEEDLSARALRARPICKRCATSRNAPGPKRN
jgi:hypothetical protein